jgi:hypothetical protein
VGELPFFGDKDDLGSIFLNRIFSFSGVADAGGFALIFELAGAILLAIIVLFLRWCDIYD